MISPRNTESGRKHFPSLPVRCPRQKKTHLTDLPMASPTNHTSERKEKKNRTAIRQNHSQHANLTVCTRKVFPSHNKSQQRYKLQLVGGAGKRWSHTTRSQGWEKRLWGEALVGTSKSVNSISNANKNNEDENEFMAS